MKNRLIIFIICFVWLTGISKASKPQAILGPGTGALNFRVALHETTNRVLSADTTYILTGWYFIDSTYSITIPAGTLIRGDSASAGALIVKRGAQIFAEGSKECPIIFTSNKPAGTRTKGDWGGIVVLGNAPTNRPTTQQIEGGFGIEPNSDAMYGGADPDDNSGIIRYVRIEFGGAVYATDNEINGLTFGGVGRGTSVDHIQVSFANDDDYEFFGGTVSAKYLVSWRNLDDGFDTDFGFDGRLQFCYIKRDPTLFDASASGSSNGFESDNEGTSPFAATPRTKARFSNMSIIGPASDSAFANAMSSKWSNLAMLRRATELSIYNSVLIGWRSGINLRDTLTQRGAIDGRLEIRNTSIAANRAPITVSSSPSTGNIAGFDPVAWFTTGTDNLGGLPRQGTDLGYNAAIWNLDATNNPIPPVGSEPDTASTSYQGRLAGDAWFDSVGYRGAFDPSLPKNQQWDWGWTNYDPQNYDPESLSVVTYNVDNAWNMISAPIKGFADPSVLSVYPTSTSSLFTYEGGYVQKSNVEHGKGYWLKFPSSQSIELNGRRSIIDTISVSSRWNMIGSVAYPVDISNIVADPIGNVISTYWSYNGSYQAATTLEPGKAYWVKVNTAGTLILDGFTSSYFPKQSPKATAAFEHMNSFTISDNKGRSQKLYLSELNNDVESFGKMEMPPVPPQGSFDARFIENGTLGTMIQTYSPYSGQISRYPIAMQSPEYPITVSWDIKNADGEGFGLEIANGKESIQHTMSGKGKVTLTKAGENVLSVTVGSGLSVPKEFALGQNYPNPFNPTTRFSVDVPKIAVVDVAVYDILGRKVATLFSGEKSPGYCTVEWNGVNAQNQAVSSGIYFIRMTSDQFSTIRKVMMMK